MHPTEDKLTSVAESGPEPATAGVAPAQVSLTVLDYFGEIDQLIYQEDELFFAPPAEQRERRLRAVRQTVAWHYERCRLYHSYCDRLGFAPDLLRGPGDLQRIPLIPTSVFKRCIIKSIADGEVEKRCVSSGASGAQSVVVRDEMSLERLLGSVRLGTKLISDWYEDQVQVFNLGPPTTEAADIWFSYVMSLVNLLYPTRNYVREHTFRGEELLADLAAADAEADGVMAIIGPPFLLAQLCEQADQTGAGFEFRERLTVVTAGGWKHHAHKMTRRDVFEQRLARVLGLASTTQIRDAFNQVELNTVFFECEHKRKHVPLWVYAAARDPLTLESLDSGGVGLLSYCDASATSYPCFILADDLGSCVEEECPCGRRGQVVDVVRRVSTSETRGCAVRMNTLVSADRRFA